MKEIVLQRINKIISYSKLNKSKFAKDIGMEQTTVNNQLIGKRGLSIDLVLSVLASFPDISAEWLLRGNGDMKISEKDNLHPGVSIESYDNNKTMEQSVKDRMDLYLDFKGISDYRFEKDLGLSKGYWNKAKNPTSEIVGKFVGFYTDISSEWLLRGEGEMLLVSDSVEDALNNEDLAKHASSIPVDPEMVNFYEDIIKRKDEEILKLQGEVYRLMMEIKKVSKGA